MGCNCKKIRQIQSENADYNMITKSFTVGVRIVLFVLMFIVSLVVIPIVAVVALYKMLFSKNKTISLGWLTKHLGK